MEPSADEVHESVRRFVDEYRERCLWFLRPDYYPEGTNEILRVLEHIERHGDHRGYQRAAEVRRWLSHRSKATSVGS